MKKKRQGTQFGILCLVVGILFLIINLYMYNKGKIFPALTVMTPGMILGGIGFLLFPGIDPPADVPEKQIPKMWWKNSPMSNKLIWLMMMGAGLAMGFWLMFTLTDWNL